MPLSLFKSAITLLPQSSKIKTNNTNANNQPPRGDRDQRPTTATKTFPAPRGGLRSPRFLRVAKNVINHSSRPFSELGRSAEFLLDDQGLLNGLQEKHLLSIRWHKNQNKKRCVRSYIIVALIMNECSSSCCFQSHLCHKM